MSKRLAEYLTSDYLGAAQKLGPTQKRHKTIVYVEGYDDILFWRNLLSDIETDQQCFEVMLPSRNTLGKGKKVAIMNALSMGLGKNLIVCVDADYDFLLQGATETSHLLLSNPYIFHTKLYAIENYQCYAPSLHSVCVMATLNDHVIFSFEKYLADYSKIVWPLLVWSVWCYSYGKYPSFPIQELMNTITMEHLDLQIAGKALDQIQRKVGQKIAQLQHKFPEARNNYKTIEERLIQLGVLPEESYLYLRGHDILEKLVLPLLHSVCKRLANERKQEIRRLAQHETQMYNELAGYEHASSNVEEMLRKQSAFKTSRFYKGIQEEIRQTVIRPTGVTAKSTKSD